MPEITTEIVRLPITLFRLDGRQVCCQDFRTGANACPVLRLGTRCTLTGDYLRSGHGADLYVVFPSSRCPLATAETARA